MVIRVERNSNYTTMSNYHLRDKDLSCKAKGLMSFMLSLPDNWDYTEVGLVACLKEGRDGVRSMLKELEERGYLVRNRTRKENGTLGQVEYVLYEKPHTPKSENPTLVKPTLVEPTLVNPTQINTNINNNTKVNNILTNICPKTGKKGFIPPTLEEVSEYIREKGYSIDAKHFMDYYEASNWHFANGKPVKSWKQCLVTWSRNGYNNGSVKQESQAGPQVPYFSKEERDKEAQRQLEELYKTL